MYIILYVKYILHFVCEKKKTGSKQTAPFTCISLYDRGICNGGFNEAIEVTVVLRQLSILEVTDVYQSHLKQDFPDNERKPLFVIHSLMKRNLYQCFGLFDDPETSLVAYAFLCQGNHSRSLILDYFTTIAGERDKGFGSLLLKLLREALPDIAGIIAEVERIEMGQDALEKQLRKRRIDFYLRNGFYMTHVRGLIFGVHFDIVYLPIQQPAENAFVLKELEDIYRTMLPPSMYEPNVHLTMA
jgi:hypothetical protein